VKSARSRPAAVFWRSLVKTGLLLLLLYSEWAGEAAAFELVTRREASLPDDFSGTMRGGPTRGPDILIRSPSVAGSLVRSPVVLKITFQAHGGAGIDRDSILVTYKKLPPVDITQRIKPYIQDDGIAIDEAELPPGAHRFQIEVRDTNGRKATELLMINIENPPGR
jgi:hypothetical protein